MRRQIVSSLPDMHSCFESAPLKMTNVPIRREELKEKFYGNTAVLDREESQRIAGKILEMENLPGVGDLMGELS